MKTIYLCFIVLFISYNLIGQRTYLGYPIEESDLKKGDIIVLEPLSWNGNRNFDSNAVLYIDKLKEFMETHPTFYYEISFHDDGKNDEFILKFTKFKAERLNEIFLSDTTFVKKVRYKVIGKGATQLLFSYSVIDGQTNILYKKLLIKLNRRVEVLLM